MQETRAWSLGWEDPLEKGMATHSSILAWRIPWIEEPGGLQSMGSQRVEHNWVTRKTWSPQHFQKSHFPFLTTWWQISVSFSNYQRWHEGTTAPLLFLSFLERNYNKEEKCTQKVQVTMPLPYSIFLFPWKQKTCVAYKLWQLLKW